MTTTNFPNGVSSFGVPVLGPGSEPFSGHTFFVSSVASDGGANGNDGSYSSPLLTLAQAITNCVAGRGDVIYLMPSFALTVAAAGVVLDKAGVTIRCLGNGRERPTFNFNALASDIDVTAANVTIDGAFFDMTVLDAVAAGIDVDAADFKLINCEFLMADSGGQATRAVVGATAADRLRILGCTVRSPNAGAASFVNLVGTADGTEIAYNHIYGDFSVAAIENAIANVNTNVNIHHNYIQNDNNGNWAIELVSATTGVISDNHVVTDAIATAVDWGSCAAFRNLYFDDGSTDSNGTEIPTAQTTGGMDLVTIGDRLGADADTDAIAAMLGGAAGIATIPAAAVPANAVNMFELLREIWAVLNGTAANENGVQTFPSGAAAANNVSMAEVLRYIQDQVINGTGTALVANTSLYGLLGGATGHPAWPTAAAYANDVSIAEVLGYIQDGTRRGTGSALPANTSLNDHIEKVVTNAAAALVNTTTIFTIAGGPIEILSLVARCVTSNDGTASTLQWSADPTDGAAATFSGASVSLANAAAGALIILLGTALTTAPTLTTTGVGLSFTGATPTNSVVVGAGIITTTVGVGSTTGTWMHHMRYRPLSTGVTVS